MTAVSRSNRASQSNHVAPPGRAPQANEGPAELVVARVVLHEGDTCSVALESGGGELVARRAASCLVGPRPGDRVLVALVPSPFVLSVLERDASRPAELVLDGDATIRSRGRLAIEAEEGLRLGTREALELRSRALDVKSGSAQLVFETVEAFALRARASFEESVLIAKTVERVADRISESAARVFRFVSEVDQLRARHFDYRAEHCAQVRGASVVVAARQVVKVDGEQVHLG